MMEWIDAMPIEQFLVLFMVVAFVCLVLPVKAAAYLTRRHRLLPHEIDRALNSARAPAEPARWDVLARHSARNDDGSSKAGI